MEIVILLGIPLLVLLIAWLQDINSKNNNLRSDSSSVRRYKQILNKSQKDWKDKNAVYTGKEQKGKNGGRYRLRETKNGKKYRQYY
tara:strand:- start:2736 stop:2993 length:258 start_codon:yes stop_codon:yes gene_type:complete